MKIGFFEIEGWEEAWLRQQFNAHELVFDDKAIGNDKTSSLASDFDIVSIFVGSKMTDEVFNKFSKLRFVTTRSVGYDHIDLAAAERHGVVVSYAPGYGDHTVAEYAFGLLLTLTRRLYHAVHRTKEEASYSFEGLRGTDLSGKTLGVIGTGRIGKRVCEIAHGFNMQLTGYDPYPDNEFAKSIGLTYVSLNELLATADVVTLHCVHNEQNHHLINQDNIKLFKKGAYIINTARGGLIETAALVTGLQNGILAGAGLDVLEEEGEIKDELHFLTTAHPKADELAIILADNVLVDLPNVIISPHNAFNTREALGRILMITGENIDQYLAGAPINLAKP